MGYRTELDQIVRDCTAHAKHVNDARSSIMDWHLLDGSPEIRGTDKDYAMGAVSVASRFALSAGKRQAGRFTFLVTGHSFAHCTLAS